MIFVDTSVWIEFLRASDASIVSALSHLLDQDRVALAAPVRLEILGGASKREYPRLRQSLSALPVFFPSEDAWALIDKWVERGLAHGQRFGIADMLIASIAAEQTGEVWSLDKDFERMATLGFLKLHRH